jgi:hypothetical protein
MTCNFYFFYKKIFWYFYMYPSTITRFTISINCSSVPNCF